MSKLININRKKIGKWRVLKYAGNSIWKCKCDCGARHDILGVVLRNGQSKQCNACKIESYRNKYIGKTYGYWKVLKYESTGRYLCECTRCNNQYSTYIVNLFHGMSKQCNACNLKYGSHGMSKTKYYRIWLNDKSRQKFCDRWARSFLDFYKDTFSGYSEGKHIVAINKNNVMSIDNYEWSEKWHSRGRAFVKIGGIIMSKSEWARHYGITRQGFEYRVKKLRAEK